MVSSICRSTKRLELNYLRFGIKTQVFWAEKIQRPEGLVRVYV